MITNPRELEAADLERSHFRDQQAEQEDNLLTTMVEIEENQSVLEAISEELARAESARETERPALEAEESLLEQRLEELRRDRTDALPQFGAQVLSIYERLREDRNGYAVARVERGMCQGMPDSATVGGGAARKVGPRADPVQQLPADTLHGLRAGCAR